MADSKPVRSSFFAGEEIFWLIKIQNPAKCAKNTGTDFDVLWRLEEFWVCMVCVAVLSRGVVAGALPLPVEGSRQVPATFISQVLITDIVY